MDKTDDRILALLNHAIEEYSKKYRIQLVPGFLSKKYIAYNSMKADLNLIIQYINELRNPMNVVISSSLSYSLISLYGKCFTDASKSSYPKLEPSTLFKESDGNYETHKYLMDLRNDFVAHRGETDNEIGISYILIPKGESLEKNNVNFSQIKTTGFSIEDLNRIEKLVKYIIEKLAVKIRKSGRKVYDSMLKLFTVEQRNLMILKEKNESIEESKVMV